LPVCEDVGMEHRRGVVGEPIEVVSITPAVGMWGERLDAKPEVVTSCDSFRLMGAGQRGACWGVHEFWRHGPLCTQKQLIEAGEYVQGNKAIRGQENDTVCP
jgi:hypothetical protein